jgi:hypothetical protein
VSQLTIPSEDAQELYHEESDGPVNGVRFVAKEYYGEWRWGIQYQLVVQDVLTEKFYQVIVNEQCGDVWYLSLEDEDQITLDEVVRIPVTTYEYRKPQDVER